MQRLWQGIGGLLLSLTLLVGGVHALARQQPAPDRIAALLPDPACAAPCWQGLRPGYVTQDDYAAWLAAPPSSGARLPLAPDPATGSAWGPVRLLSGTEPTALVRFESDNGRTIGDIALTPDTLTLGELVGAWREPDFIAFYFGSAGRLSVVLYYLDAQVIVSGDMPSDIDAKLTPTLRVGEIIYPAQRWARPALAQPWRGFGPLRRYFPASVVP